MGRDAIPTRNFYWVDGNQFLVLGCRLPILRFTLDKRRWGATALSGVLQLD
jgi:hypothetical protein